MTFFMSYTIISLLCNHHNSRTDKFALMGVVFKYSIKPLVIEMINFLLLFDDQ